MPSSWKGDELGFLLSWKWGLPCLEKTEPMKATVRAPMNGWPLWSQPGHLAWQPVPRKGTQNLLASSGSWAVQSVRVKGTSVMEI